MSRLPVPELREISLQEDREAVEILHRRCGLAVNPNPLHWAHLLGANPARTRSAPPPALGWVLTHRGTVVGSMLNIPLLYVLGPATYRVAAGRSLAVAPEFRGFGLKLLQAFLGQEGIDLWLATTVHPQLVAPIYLKLFSFSALPQPEYFHQCLWVMDPRAFAREYARKRQLAFGRKIACRFLLPPLILVDRWVRKRRPPKPRSPLESSILSPQEIGDEFTALWQRVSSASPYFLQVRDAEMLRWRFGSPGLSHPPVVVRLCRAGSLVGYAIMQLGVTGGGLLKASVVDLLAEGEDRQVIAALLYECYSQAVARRVAILEILGFPPQVRLALRQANPFVRDLAPEYANSFLYFTQSESLRNVLRRGEAWYACPSDGDGSL